MVGNLKVKRTSSNSNNGRDDSVEVELNNVENPEKHVLEPLRHAETTNKDYAYPAYLAIMNQIKINGLYILLVIITYWTITNFFNMIMK